MFQLQVMRRTPMERDLRSKPVSSIPLSPPRCRPQPGCRPCSVWRRPPADVYKRQPTTLICDNMSAAMMREGRIQAVFVGCDRVAANGDTANKIGTSMVALAAQRYGVPFYVCAPTSTIDLQTPTGTDYRKALSLINIVEKEQPKNGQLAKMKQLAETNARLKIAIKETIHRF